MIWLWSTPKSTGAATHESTIIAAASAAPPLHADAAQARHRSLCACVDRLIGPPLPPVACRLPLSCALARAGRPPAELARPWPLGPWTERLKPYAKDTRGVHASSAGTFP